jgi:hypothetical protein
MLIVMLAAVTTSSVCLALVSVHKTGTWPDTWPKELEPYRRQATTFDVGTGTQEVVHEIPFSDRESFEKTWPHVLKLKSPGAPLIIERSPSSQFGSTEAGVEAGVRILSESGGVRKLPDGTRLTAAPPWPDSVTSGSKVLPEYVVEENGTWVPAEPIRRDRFNHRARVDIVLITDGKIVDLNRIPLPPDTPIIDNRFRERSQ